MVDVTTLDSLKQLSAEDRRVLIEELWLSLADEPFVPELTNDLKQELECRRAALKAHPERSQTWDEVVARIQTRTQS